MDSFSPLDFSAILPARPAEQLSFLLEIDKLKNVLRQCYLTDLSRRENTAEHSWHAAMLAVVLREYASSPVCLEKVVKMLLIHDLVEIDAGDTMLYNTEENHSKEEREQLAAGRIFGLLPAGQAEEFQNFWDEFEAQITPEARYAQAIDRLVPLLLCLQTGGYGWRKNHIRYADVIQKTRPKIERACPELWTQVESLLNEAVAKGFLEN